MLFRRQMLLCTSSKNTYDHLMSTFFSLFCLINSEKVKKINTKCRVVAEEIILNVT